MGGPYSPVPEAAPGLSWAGTAPHLPDQGRSSSPSPGNAFGFDGGRELLGPGTLGEGSDSRPDLGHG
jgi:hypothetical protein